ncbi:MAG: hypothetical protein K2V38_02740 [Gemmataceae bacterium]|nr:hypothetical protein [Gemmataceae bacterium]
MKLFRGAERLAEFRRAGHCCRASDFALLQPVERGAGEFHLLQQFEVAQPAARRAGLGRYPLTELQHLAEQLPPRRLVAELLVKDASFRLDFVQTRHQTAPPAGTRLGRVVGQGRLEVVGHPLEELLALFGVRDRAADLELELDEEGHHRRRAGPASRLLGPLPHRGQVGRPSQFAHQATGRPEQPHDEMYSHF